MSLPQTPNKRKQVVAAYLANEKSPTVKQLINTHVVVSPMEREKISLAKCLIEDIRSVVKKSKSSRSAESLMCMNSVVASVSGKSIEKSKKKTHLAKSLGLPARKIRGGKRIRTEVLKAEKCSWSVTKTKTRTDDIAQSDKKLAYDVWLSPNISRPTGNKKDIKRIRTGTKKYTAHMIHVLEKTQLETYNDFKKAHPTIKMSLKTSERCKPFLTAVYGRVIDKHAVAVITQK